MCKTQAQKRNSKMCCTWVIQHCSQKLFNLRFADDARQGWGTGGLCQRSDPTSHVRLVCVRHTPRSHDKRVTLGACAVMLFAEPRKIKSVAVNATKFNLGLISNCKTSTRDTGRKKYHLQVSILSSILEINVRVDT